MATDMLRFEGATPEPYLTGWNGPWPPPQRMIMAIGHTSGYVSIFGDDAETIEKAAPIATVIRFGLTSASILPESVRDEPHNFRGAVYQPID